MDTERLLALLRAHLNILTTFLDEEAKAAQDAELMIYIKAAADFIKTEGINQRISEYDWNDGDAFLLTMYAGYLYNKRLAENAPMPRMLRYALNNRLFSQKMQEET